MVMRNNFSKTSASKALTVLMLLLFLPLSLWAQQMTVKGVVSDETGEPVIGASVLVKGTGNGTITDLDGRFTLSDVAKGASIDVSYVGYVTQTVAAAPVLSIVLREDAKTLDDVVVVGYGTQKKSVVTAAIAKVDAGELGNVAPVRVDNALKGLAAGVTVTSSSGQPGAAAQIRIRGIGTINNSDPLYIVDGMPIEGGIDYLNPNDIQSIEVLKDAASGAVYGARAANGVVLVTTKTGTKGKATISYDVNYGWQSAWRHRDVLNASEYAVMMNEGRLNAGMAPLYNDPASYGEGTDWQSLVFNDNAPVKSHQVAISGGSDKGNYMLSGGYYSQDGIVGGNYGRSNYDRLTLRSNNNYTVFDSSAERNWLNSLKLNANISYANIKSTGISTNSEYGSMLGSALALSPILTPYADEAQAAVQEGLVNYVPMYSADGQLYMVPGGNYNEMVNPLASLSMAGSEGWSHKFVMNVGAELQLWDGLKFKTSYGTDLSFWGSDGYTPIYYLGSNNYRTFSSVSSEMDRSSVWQLENLLSYDKTFGQHTVNVILGQSAKKTNGSYYLGGSAYHMKDASRPYISYTDALQEEGEMSIYGGKNANATLASYFARFSYDYAERYMAQATVRRDGSSRFGSNNHWATFPSVSLGWNLHNEPYLDMPSWLSTSKVRFSWGKNGNENIGNFGYTVLTATGNNYLFGSGENMTNGVKASGLANPSLRWEESTQTDVGVDLGFFDGALALTVDYYNKITDGMLMTMNIPSYVGESKPTGNVGKMQNSGVEMEAMYRITAGDFNFRLGGNLTYLKNVLIEYGNDSGWANYDSFQGVGTVSRAQNGYPFPFFYGLQTDGVYQTAEEAAAGPLWSDGTQPVAGDVRFKDISGPDGVPDGVIDDNDRTYIGKGMPDWTYGLNLQMSYKGFDLSAVAQGVWGCQIYDATRRTDISTVNLPSYMLGRWTGGGTSDRLPRFVLGDNHNWVSSDLYVYDGSYFRLKNVQLGYTLPKKLTLKAFIDNFRVYVAGENLLTFTKYHGYDPEISSGGTSLGIDRGVYPQARTFSIGANITFGTKGDKAPVVAPVVKYVESEPVVREVVKEVYRDAPAKGSNPIDDNLYFVIGSSELEAGQAFKLGRLYQVLLENPDMKIEIYGSADSATGTAEINKQLSKARAQVVKDKLTEAGISADRISTAAIIDNNANAAPEENRVAVCIVK